MYSGVAHLESRFDEADSEKNAVNVTWINDVKIPSDYFPPIFDFSKMEHSFEVL